MHKQSAVFNAGYRTQVCAKEKVAELPDKYNQQTQNKKQKSTFIASMSTPSQIEKLTKQISHLTSQVEELPWDGFKYSKSSLRNGCRTRKQYSKF